MKYKTLEELKKELGDKFEEFLYESNIELMEKENKLIKYLEDKINRKNAEIRQTNVMIDREYFNKGLMEAYQDILERVKSGKYE